MPSGATATTKSRRPITIEPVIKPGSRKAIAGLRLFVVKFSERPDLLRELAAAIVRNAKP